MQFDKLYEQIMSANKKKDALKDIADAETAEAEVAQAEADGDEVDVNKKDTASKIKAKGMKDYASAVSDEAKELEKKARQHG